MIAGRCACGVALALIPKRDLDAHMRCIGLRWCGVCGEVAHYVHLGRGRCPHCSKRYQRTYRRSEKGRLTRKFRELDMERKPRTYVGPAYERDKERKRLRYATDPIYAEAKRAAARKAA